MIGGVRAMGALVHAIAWMCLLGCLDGTAHAATIQRKALVSSGGSYATAGNLTLNANFGDILVGPSTLGTTEAWLGFWGPLTSYSVGVEEPRVPRFHFLRPPMPNPSRSTILIEFGLPLAETVSLRIYDLSGRMVRELGRGERPAGIERQAWNLLTGTGERVPAGVYFTRLTTGSFTAVRKFVVLD